ncbi:MAG: hypothetical protein IPH60_15270 [Flavobacteriales bacterium]|nr:hypothetical protein [Flavobacteriales bacterium]
MHRAHLTILLACCLAPALWAQQVEVTRYDVDQGLPQSMVNHVLQDSDGFLWLGTGDGLARFDGERFVVYKHDGRDSTSLSNNRIWGLAEADAQHLWVGTRSGLDRLDRRTRTLRARAHGRAGRLLASVRCACRKQPVLFALAEGIPADRRTGHAPLAHRALGFIRPPRGGRWPYHLSVPTSRHAGRITHPRTNVHCHQAADGYRERDQLHPAAGEGLVAFRPIRIVSHG